MSQTQAPAARPRVDYGRWLSLAIVVVILIAGGLTISYWLPPLRGLLSPPPAGDSPHGVDADHDHDHAHDDADSIEISPQAQASIGVKLGPVKLQTFERAITLPGMVVERAGRSRLAISAPLTGVVTRIFVTHGEAVRPGDKLFEMRLTHEELVQSQAELLRVAEELDIVRREVARLETVTREGAIAAKAVLERKYEQQKLEAALRVARQGLLLHHFSDDQVDEILETRKLLSTLVVEVPSGDELGMDVDPATLFQVQELATDRGQHVEHGAPLATLTDHAELLIEGEAFEQDAALISTAMNEGAAVTAVLERGGKLAEVKPLRIRYLANRLDPATRTLHFYVALPNELVRDADQEGQPQFVQWKYKPGQRMSLRIPVETWTDRIVLPADAVAQDGVENYVFVAREGRFHRQAVHVEHRDPLYVVIAPDGGLAPGKFIAMQGAQQILLALKNKSGGGVDPHAGHTH